MNRIESDEAPGMPGASSLAAALAGFCGAQVADFLGAVDSRNPRCTSYGVSPDPYKRPPGAPSAPPGTLRGTVTGKRDELFFQCPTCRTTSRLKSNRAIAEEYRRLARLQSSDPKAPGCRTEGCFAAGMSVAAHPEFYRKFGRTKNGDPRFQCRLCRKTFSVGRPARRHRRSDKNGLILNMLVNGVPLSKICVIAKVSYHNVYRKIDFIHAQVKSFVARRESFSQVDFREVGSRFATDSQTLTINWPTKRERTPVMVQHLCTAHARSGYIMEAAIQFDPSLTMQEVETRMLDAGDFRRPQAFRENARVWSRTEFDDHIRRLKQNRAVQDVDVYQLPHTGALVRYDILQFAHAMRLREMLRSTDAPLVLVLDDDKGLRAAFASAFVEEVRAERAEIAVVSFDKGATNDQRNQAVAAGQRRLASLTGLSVGQLRALSNQDYADLVDQEVALQVAGRVLATGFQFPFDTKSEPSRNVRLLTAPPGRSDRSSARLIRLATLRSVDSYFHKVRSNLTFAARPSQTTSGNRQSWDRYYLYKPELMVKIAEIYRFHHNWCGDGKKDTPAMKLGLARGRIYERDVL